MKKSQRLKTVLKLAQMREDEALYGLGLAQQQLAREQQRLADITQYQGEYLEQFQHKARLGLDGHSVRDFRLFIDKLGLAIGQQQQQIRFVEQGVQQARGHWQLMHAKRKAMENLIAKYQREEQFQQDKKEQKESDDRSQHGSNRFTISSSFIDPV